MGRLNLLIFWQRKRAALLAAAAATMALLQVASAGTLPVVTNNPPIAAKPLEFMPELERVLPATSALGERCYLDFEGGTVATERRAENPQLNRQLHRDLKADLTPAAEQWAGIGLLLTPATDELWDAPADQVIAALADHLADAPPTLPVTRALWLFKTADGNYGLMRVEGMVDTPGGGRGMKIVYKLAKAASPAKVVASVTKSWGEVTNGLRSRIVLDKKVFRAGQPVPVRIEIENVVAEVKSFTHPYAQYNQAFIVINSSGKEVPYVGGLAQVMVGNPETLESGRSAIFGPFNLADYYYLRIPGSYTVKWRGNFAMHGIDRAPVPVNLPPSAEVRFEVTADSVATADGDPAGRLLPLLKDKWLLTAANPKPVHLHPGGNHAEVSGQSFYFNYYPTNRREDAGGISLWLTEQPAADQNMTNDWPLPSEYLGKLSRWHVYFNVDSNAAKAWPDAREDIKQALSAETDAKAPR
jgi:hypothetical protein